ncbi:MAG: glycine zipper family protein [Rhodoferax sp.]
MHRLTLTACATLATSLLLTACAASSGPNSPNAGPVLYPNATYNSLGEARARDEVATCTGRASAAGLTPEEKDNAVAQGATKGAAVGGVAGAVSAAVRGRSLENVLGSGAAGAAIGGSAGATAGAFHNKPSQTYRHFVQRCLHDKGLDVIGWN